MPTNFTLFLFVRASSAVILPACCSCAKCADAFGKYAKNNSPVSAIMIPTAMSSDLGMRLDLL
jgi:hypothetical protein